MRIFGDDSSIESLEIHKLKVILGAASREGWLHFMDYACQQMNFLMKRGRPSNAAISESIVGRAGYKTWEGFIHHELRLRPSTWKVWKKAYRVLIEHGYLRSMEVTPAQINKVAEHTKNGAFPENEFDLQSALKEIIDTTQSQRSRNLSAAEKRNNFLQDQLQKAEIRNQQLLSEVQSCQESKKHLEKELTTKDIELENCREIAELYKRVILELVSHSTLLQKPIKTLYLLHDTEKELSTWKLLTRPPLDHANQLKDIGEQIESIKMKMTNTMQRAKKIKLEMAA